MEDDEQSRHPKDTTTDKNIELVQCLIMCDRKRSLHVIARQIGISFGAVQSSLTNFRDVSGFS